MRDTETAARLLLAIAGVLAVSGKLRIGWQPFVLTVRQLTGLPRRIAKYVATAVVLGEALIVPLVLFTHDGPYAAGAVYTVFASVIFVNLVRHNRVPCGCFGSSGSETISSLVLARTLALSATAFYAAAADRPALWQPTQHLVLSMQLAVGSMIVLRLVTLLPDVLAMLQSIETPIQPPNRRVRLPDLYPELYRVVASSDPRIRNGINA